MPVSTLKRPSEFKRVRGGLRFAGPLFIIEGRARSEVASGEGSFGPRFGFTITRKVGGAVVRNRIRRRLKEALRLIGPGKAQANFDYVVVPNRTVAEHPFDELKGALEASLVTLHIRGASAARRERPEAALPPGSKSGKAKPRKERADGPDRATAPEPSQQSIPSPGSGEPECR